MTEHQREDLAFRADITTHRPTASLAVLVTELRSEHPDIDLLPPPRQGDGAPALLDIDSLKAVVRAGYTVTITGIEEGPPDPDMVMTDAQAERRMAELLGENRIARGEAD